MDIFGIVACAVCAVIFAALLKRSNREYALVLTAGAAVLILLSVLEQSAPLVSQIESLGEAGAFSNGALTVMLKAVGIAIAGQLASSVCKDAGESALACTVDLAAKAAILASAMPLVLRLFEYLEEIIKL